MVVGHVVDMRGAHEGYAIKRSSSQGRYCPPEPSRLWHFTPICTGDQLVITSRRGELQLRFNGSERIVSVRAENSPYEIDIHSARRSRLDGLVNQLSAMMAGLLPAQQEALMTDIDVFSRALPGTALAVPVLQLDKPQLLASGERLFTLAWSGGESPFMVEMRQAGTKAPLYEWTVADKHRLMPTKIELVPGDITLAITDSLGESLEATLRVVPQDQLPSWRATPTLEHQSLEAALHAAWLANQSDQWLLEGALRALAVGDRFPAALVLGNRLLQGLPPHHFRG